MEMLLKHFIRQERSRRVSPLSEPKRSTFVFREEHDGDELTVHRQTPGFRLSELDAEPHAPLVGTLERLLEHMPCEIDGF